MKKLTIEEIKKIDVRHTSFLPDGCKMYDNFLIVDTLLERIEELEAALKGRNILEGYVPLELYDDDEETNYE